MNDMIEKRTPEQIGAEIRMYMDVGRRVTLLCGIEIGRRLVEAKEMLPHGEWLPWLQRETEFSSSSAQRYMKVYEEYGATQQNDADLMQMPICKALELIKIPEKERKEIAKEVAASNMSIRELKTELKKRYGEENGRKKIQKTEIETVLKRCPFCGGTAELMIKGNAIKNGEVMGYIMVKCMVCGATGKSHYYCGPDPEKWDHTVAESIGGKKAVEAWNMRWNG